MEMWLFWIVFTIVLLLVSYGIEKRIQKLMERDCKNCSSETGIEDEKAYKD